MKRTGSLILLGVVLAGIASSLLGCPDNSNTPPAASASAQPGAQPSAKPAGGGGW